MRDRLIRLSRVGPPVLWNAPTASGTPSVPSDFSSSTEFSSSSSPSSPGPLKMLLEVPGNPPTTAKNEFDLLGPLPSFLDGASPCPQEELLELDLEQLKLLPEILSVLQEVNVE
ncbi:hypothetical protein O181_021129 [Austropuccinia psidii MF-1]|uniref:Uncharacterized protein n=1 Tax=Austropuccinia psidii MF-1 TaxID=1389203 RepID=A0A9Q3CCK4_9BASI|nr:hypothetical protein [Austropuccinia psidii MF-1]